MPFTDLKALYDQPPPAFGKEMLKHFAMDPAYVNLNNGSYGTPPRAVLQAAFDITTEIEANPERFHRFGYQERLKEARANIAGLIGAHQDECFLVNNATTGVGTVLRNFEWEKDDVIITFNTSYSAMANQAQYLSDVPPHPKVVVFQLNFPTTFASIVSSFTSLLASPQAQVGPNNKRVVVIDSIISNPGVLLPWQELVKIAKDAGVWTIVDAAHSIGQELDINLGEVQPDFWTSNCHKWLYAKRSCAVLYIPFRNQHIIKTTVPTSNYYVALDKRNGNPNLLEQFEWLGTIDFAPFLSVNEAFKFRAWLGGEHKINAYCHDIALKAGKRLAEILGTEVMDEEGSQTLNMVNVALPLPTSLKWSNALYKRLNGALIEDHNTYSAWFFHNGKWWTRVSLQVFNEVDEVEVLGKAWLQVSKDLVKDLEDGTFKSE
ncbi:PLP-dependent transferase [Coprinellus micaceus]|uniref:PLP-dependent transferase n=1 Tax=Coprinellus micaceus TaxID=71717 RepID=A0A4Y7SK80_COPMI|nr:PLP-dependent transferase [Coprinellus micaceus]